MRCNLHAWLLAPSLKKWHVWWFSTTLLNTYDVEGVGYDALMALHGRCLVKLQQICRCLFKHAYWLSTAARWMLAGLWPLNQHACWPFVTQYCTGPRSAVGHVSGNRCESDCRSRGREFDPGPVPYFRGDWSGNKFYGHSPPFRWIIQEGLLSVTSESMCRKYWLTACSSLPRKKCG